MKYVLAELTLKSSTYGTGGYYSITFSCIDIQTHILVQKTIEQNFPKYGQCETRKFPDNQTTFETKYGAHLEFGDRGKRDIIKEWEHISGSAKWFLLKELCENGWEPFSVKTYDNGDTYFFRCLEQ